MRNQSTENRGSRCTNRPARLVAICASFMIVAFVVTAQEEDPNTRYAFPASLGVEYQLFTPFASEATGFTAFEVGGSLRIPMPRRPSFQPALRFGWMQFTDEDPSDGDWSHSHYYGGLGVTLANRFDRRFEVAADLAIGVSEAIFPALAPEVGTIGSLYGFAEVGGRISLDPSYSVSIDIHPNLKWLQSFSPLQDFNGPVFGVGFALNYRFGEDPDSAAAIIRSLGFASLDFPDAFAALRSYYAANPSGSIRIENVESHDVTDLQISFIENQFMEAPTPCAEIDLLEPGQSVMVDLYASYNSDVFMTEGTTPLVGEIIATYTYRGRPVEQRYSVAYVLRDKTNLTWTDTAKVAAFITYEDSAIRNYASWVRQAIKEETASGVSSPLQTAIGIYEALGTYGVIYQTDPSKPAFEEVQGNPVVIDSVSLPRDTLQRTTGDCDDLTVLYCSLLESVGIDTAFITTPGHIYAAFNTGVEASRYAQLHPDRNMALPIEGELWVPVEITLIGSQGFASAWRRGIDEWTQYDGNPGLRDFVITDEAQTTYWPVGLLQTDLGIQYGQSEAVAQAFAGEFAQWGDVIVSGYRQRAEETGHARDYNQLGIAYARIGRLTAAEDVFERALEIEPDYLAASTNMANIAFLRTDYETSLELYEGIYQAIESRGTTNTQLAATVLLNMSRAHYELQSYDDAREVYGRATRLDPSIADSEFAYLAAASDDGRRAAEQPSGQIRFAGEE